MGISACLTSANVMADGPAVVDASSPAIQAPKDAECSKELLLAYFPDIFVKETFVKFNVAKDKWEPILKGLNEKDKEVIKTVEDKASKMNPNPLKDPTQRQAAVKLFRETLLEIFSNVLKNNGITDEKQISSMLDDIQQQKAKRFALCIKKDNEAKKLNDDNDDDDDEDDEGDEDDEDDEDDRADVKAKP